MQRRLATILAADIVGYSRIMEADEEATFRELQACREILDGLVAEHDGRVFGGAGDSLVAEFPSPVEAVRCAVDIQQALEAFNAGRDEERRMRLRIGVNLADVIVEDDNLYGAGVNFAARLETLADADGIFLSRPVVEQVRKQLELGYEDLGTHIVKNIVEPVQVYRVLTDPVMAGRVLAAPQRAKRRTKGMGVAIVIVLFFALAAALAWQRQGQPSIEPASVARMAYPLSDKPSIAILPFADLSGESGGGGNDRDDSLGHIADGLTEDITTRLSQISSLFVIARDSSFVYRGKTAPAREVAEDLGVRYLLQGSVQASGNRLRITARLIDALGGNHLWSERYDRDLTEVFALQDEITDRIVTALRIRLTEGEEIRVHRRHTASLEAWNLLSRGKEHFHRATKADNATAREDFAQAIEVDPDYALAYAFLAWTHWHDAFQLWSVDREASVRRAASLAQKAHGLDEALPDVHALRGATHLFNRDYDAAIEAGERAVASNPNHASNTALLALILHNAGRPQEAIRRYRSAMRLSPYYPAWFLEELGFTHLAAGQADEALAAFETFLDRQPAIPHAAHAQVGRALALHALDREQEARAAVGKAIETDAGISATGFKQLSLARDRAALERGLTILRGLGLPE